MLQINERRLGPGWRCPPALGWSYPGLYNGDKNLDLLAARVSREKKALKPGWMSHGP
jgi:hypothetical protein